MADIIEHIKHVYKTSNLLGSHQTGQHLAAFTKPIDYLTAMRQVLENSKDPDSELVTIGAWLNHRLPVDQANMIMENLKSVAEKRKQVIKQRPSIFSIKRLLERIKNI